jgi:hypothetical protein
MPKSVPLDTLKKLTTASNQAGFRFEEIISLLRAGVTIEKLLALIESGLIHAEPSETKSSPWIM